MLDALLDAFGARHRRMRVVPRPLDVTDCFWSPVAERYVRPRGFGPLGGERRVLAYLALGAPLVRKYQRGPDGLVARGADGVPLTGAFDDDARTMACLCLRDIRNTSLHEIRDAMMGTHRIQGFRRWHVRRLEEALALAHPGFEPEGDSAFLFAGAPGRVLPRVALSALWLSQVVSLGSRAPETLAEGEADLMAQVFPAPVLAGDAQAVEQAGYMWNRPLWQPQSALFLARKMAARRKAVAAGGSHGSGVRAGAGLHEGTSAAPLASCSGPGSRGSSLTVTG